MIRAAVVRLRTFVAARKRGLVTALLAICGLWGAVGCYNVIKPLPSDLSFHGDRIAVSETSVRALTDLTSRDEDGAPRHEHEIFDEVIRLVDGARRLILLDLFLFNDHLGLETTAHREISSELTDALLRARRRSPGMPVVFVTDPINDVYGGDPSHQLDVLRDAGVSVVITDLLRLRDSNPLFSAGWRLTARWWGNSADSGWLPNPLDPAGRTVTLRTWLRLANFKANHRKVVLADAGDQWVSLVTSANPHDGSSAHSNISARIKSDAFARQVYRAEMEVVRLSGAAPPFESLPELDGDAETGDHLVSYLTESAIRETILHLIDTAGPGDEIDLAVFYLSHRRILDALVAAAERGVWIRVVLDPNRDAFGHEKSGVPNRQSAGRLHRASNGAIAVRWYATHGEQFHIKLVVVRRQRSIDAILGSANFTRRNLDDYNLEASVWVSAPRNSAFDRDLKLGMDRIWTNPDGLYTLPYEAFEDESKLRRLSAWLQERTGVSTF